jgi:curved DNA-binding protein CbpA
MADDPYDVLGVEPGTDITQIRRVYLNELRRSHPDLFPGDAAAEQRTRDLNRAWAEVSGRQVRGAPATGRRPAAPRTPQPAYSDDRSDFRAAFTTATLRIVLAIVAIGLVLLAVQAS